MSLRKPSPQWRSSARPKPATRPLPTRVPSAPTGVACSFYGLIGAVATGAPLRAARGAGRRHAHGPGPASAWSCRYSTRNRCCPRSTARWPRRSRCPGTSRPRSRHRASSIISDWRALAVVHGGRLERRPLRQRAAEPLLSSATVRTRRRSTAADARSALPMAAILARLARRLDATGPVYVALAPAPLRELPADLRATLRDLGATGATGCICMRRHAMNKSVARLLRACFVSPTFFAMHTAAMAA